MRNNLPPPMALKDHIGERARITHRWGILWRSDNWLDGYSSHLVADRWVDRILVLTRATCMPILFDTRKQARDFIFKEYGWIDHRPDLRNQPHGWKKPVPVKLMITFDITGLG